MNDVSTPAVIRCEDLGKTYAEGQLQVDVIQGLSLEIKAGERLAIVGSSGSGKSTLLHLLGGLDRPSTGKVWVDDKDLSTLDDNAVAKLRNDRLGFVYQFHHLLPEFTALENVAMPLMIGGASAGLAREKAAEMLGLVGLSERVEHKPAELSGGERQRCAIARALVTNPACVLADEPTGNLDPRIATQVYDLMLKLNQEQNTAFVVVTHDLELAAKMDRALQLVDGVLKIV